MKREIVEQPHTVIDSFRQPSNNRLLCLIMAVYRLWLLPWQYKERVQIPLSLAFSYLLPHRALFYWNANLEGSTIRLNLQYNVIRFLFLVYHMVDKHLRHLWLKIQLSLSELPYLRTREMGSAGPSTTGTCKSKASRLLPIFQFRLPFLLPLCEFW